MSIYGPLITTTDVEAAVENLVKAWIDTYLGEVERQSSGRWDLRQIARPRSWEIVSDVEATPDRNLPAVVVEAGLIEHEDAEEGRVDGAVGIVIYVFAKGNKRRETRDIVGAYEAAIRLLLLKRGSLDGFADDTIVGESGIDAWSPARSATIARAVIRCVVVVPDIANRFGGPEVPDDPPPTPLPPVSPDDPDHTSTNVAITPEL